METINPKSMFTKGQTAYSIALLSYKDDETEKIITHTISKVGRSFVYDEKETKYHYSNKYKAFISADAFHHQQAIFPTEKAVQEYLERSRLYFDLIRLNSYDWDDLTLAELRSVGEIILKDHKKAFVKNPTVEEITMQKLSLKMYRMVKMQIPSWQICARKLPWKNPDLLMMYLIHGKPHRLLMNGNLLKVCF